MKKTVGFILFAVMSVLFLGWTWMAGLVIIGEWITLPYSLLAVLTVASFVAVRVNNKKAWRIIRFVCLCIPLAVGLVIIAVELVKLAIAGATALLYLVFHH